VQTSLTLQQAGAGDRDLLLQIYGSTRADELALTDWTNEQKAVFTEMQFEAQHRYYTANYPDARFLVIEQDGVPAGRLYVVRWPGEIRIIDIALLPRHRRQGIGSHLLREIQEEARRDGLAVTIHVERFNPALRLYERLGFQLVEDGGVYLLLRWTPPV
jgi:ribosomal protein S18 acetylase RimI-like enzyme